MLSYKDQINHPNWQKCRLRIFERDKFACKICGNTELQLQVHHLCYFPKLHLWDYDDELMITVCPEHHQQLNIDLPKIAGIIAFQILKGNIDVCNITNLLKLLNKAA